MDNVQLTIRRGIEDLRKAGAAAAAEYLDKKMARGPYFVRFEPDAPGETNNAPAE